MYVAGIDIGSVAAKSVILESLPNEAPRICSHFVQPSGWNVAEAAEQVLEKVCGKANIKKDELSSIIATGYGRVSVPFANKSITEISCHAKGASFLFPETGIVIDIGGQDSKVISLNLEQASQLGRYGVVHDFLMNDKCAAGTGRFLQVISGILEVSLEELSNIALEGTPIAITSMCAVFAETEIIGLLAKGTSPKDIAAGVFLSIAKRMCGLAKRISFNGECTFTGGLAISSAFASFLSEELGAAINIPNNPQIVGALGAALIALEKAKNTH